MSKYLIVANWKCNPTSEKEALKLFNSVKKSVNKIKNTEVVICPPFVYLALKSFSGGGFSLGAQNVFFKERGAFTGTVSPLMLKDLKVKYVILGHSEVREYLGEDNKIINKKTKLVLNVGLIPILCVGEKDGEEKSIILEEQVKECLKGVLLKDMKNVIVAYEPVWAIGTGKNCSVDETMSSILLIKSIITKLYNRGVADKVKIIYGGSVNSENSESYIKNVRADGLLVGGASLNSEDFIKIVKSVS